jgi:hypothetical protein
MTHSAQSVLTNSPSYPAIATMLCYGLPRPLAAQQPRGGG